MIGKVLKRGFTLIELLVVISIISLLSSIVLASLTDARAKARDAKRALDIKNIYTALQIYLDKYGCLPRANNTGCTTVTDRDVQAGYDFSSLVGSNYGGSSSCSDSGPSCTPGAIFLPFLENGEIMKNVPVDPINNLAFTNDTQGYAYRYFCYSTTDSGNPNGIRLSYWKERPVRQIVTINDPSAASFCK